MPHRLLLALAIQAASSAVAVPTDAVRYNWNGQQSFIAPSGEPFRAPLDAKYPSADWFDRADANQDGKLTEAEFTADFLRFFAALDTNHDGVIDGAEQDQYENVIAPEVHSRGWGGDRSGDAIGGSRDGGLHRGGRSQGGFEGGEHRGGNGGQSGNKIRSHGGGAQEDYASHPQGAARFDLLGMPEPVTAMDVNLNGRITRAEALDAAAQRFEFLDAAHRGYLTFDRLPQTYVQQHRPRQRNARQGKGSSDANSDR